MTSTSISEASSFYNSHSSLIINLDSNPNIKKAIQHSKEKGLPFMVLAIEETAQKKLKYYDILSAVKITNPHYYQLALRNFAILDAKEDEKRESSKEGKVSKEALKVRFTPFLMFEKYQKETLDFFEPSDDEEDPYAHLTEAPTLLSFALAACGGDKPKGFEDHSIEEFQFVVGKAFHDKKLPNYAKIWLQCAADNKDEMAIELLTSMNSKK